MEPALSLPPADRARVASSLLASLDDDQADASEVEQQWSAETERRMARLSAGEAQTFTRDEVHAGLHGLRDAR